MTLDHFLEYAFPRIVVGTLAVAGIAVVAAGVVPLCVRRHVAMEAKVVEIHMTRKSAATVETEKSSSTVTVLPFAHATCSGSFIDADGDVLTARHCVNGFDAFEVQTADASLYEAVVVATSPVHDLAVLHIDRRNTPYFKLADTVERGEKIHILGSPLGITNTLSEGIIAKLAGDITYLDCGALPGNSGSAVLDSHDHMIGVLNAGLVVMFGVTHLNVAQGLDAVRYFLADVEANRGQR